MRREGDGFCDLKEEGNERGTWVKVERYDGSEMGEVGST